ncbi:MAG: hypothetical protein IRZ09_12440 [Variibacter sp.]|nr:hypothetical protein [Variibacter sp.]
MTLGSIAWKRFARAGLLVAAVVLAGAGATAFARTRPVPWIAQKTASDCGRAVLASLAARRGGDVQAIYRRLPDPPDPLRGYSINDMRRFGARVGVSLSVLAPGGVVIAGDCTPRPAVAAHLRRLAGHVSSGRPVVVPVASGFGAGHYLILVGANAGAFTAMDPARPGLSEIAADRLAALMCDFGYLALVSR